MHVMGKTYSKFPFLIWLYIYCIVKYFREEWVLHKYAKLRYYILKHSIMNNVACYTFLKKFNLPQI